MSYVEFVRAHTRLALFGPLFTFFSSFGQTFFISLSVPFILSELGLGSAAFGALYSAATLASALSLMWLGPFIDRHDLKHFSTLVALGLALAALLMAASFSVALLFVALYGLRLFGQGLCVHVAQTTMARYFHNLRGRALSISILGIALGEALLPSLFALSLGWLSWHQSWLGVSLVAVLVLLPLMWLLLRGVETHPQRQQRSDGGAEGVTRSWRRREVLAEPRFYCILPAALLSPFLLTGLFLYQLLLAQHKGWSLEVMATAFIFFAAAKVVISLVVGPLIDRWSARRIYPLMLLPLLVGVVVLWRVEALWAPYVYLLLAGMAEGMGGSVKSALWAELYGVRTLGAIRSMMTTFVLVSTAVSPVLFGWLLDVGIGFEMILPVVCGVIVLTMLLATRLYRWDGRQPAV